MRSIESSSPRKANGAIIAPVLTPVTTSNFGRAVSPVTRPQPFSTPAPNAPQSPPPEMTSRSMVGGAPPAVLPAATLSWARCRNPFISTLKSLTRTPSSDWRAAKSSATGRSGRPVDWQPAVIPLARVAMRRMESGFISLEPEGGAQRRTAEAEILEKLVAALVIKERAVGEHHIAPLEAIGDAEHRLPGEIGRAGAYVEVVRREPCTLPPAHAAAHADDAVPQVGAPGNAARGGKSLAAAWTTDRRAELPVGARFDVEVAEATQHVERAAR